MTPPVSTRFLLLCSALAASITSSQAQEATTSANTVIGTAPTSGPALISTSDSRQNAPGTPRGLIPVRNARPFHLLFLQFAPDGTDVLERGQKRLGVQLDIINNLLIPNIGANGAAVVEDNETQRLQLSWRKGIGAHTEAGFTLPVMARNGGILDGPISAYHRLLGISGDGEDNPVGRDNIPRGRSVLFYQTANGETVNSGNAFGLGDASFWVKREIAGGARSALMVRGGLKVPTGSRSKFLGSGGVDFGLVLDGRIVLARRVWLYASAGGVAMGRAKSLPGARRGMAQGALGLEWSRKRDSFVAQVDANSRVVTTGNDFADRTPVTATVGYKRDLNRGRSFYASFSENGDYHNYHAPLFGNIGPDFTLTLGLEWKR